MVVLLVFNGEGGVGDGGGWRDVTLVFDEYSDVPLVTCESDGEEVVAGRPCSSKGVP